MSLFYNLKKRHVERETKMCHVISWEDLLLFHYFAKGEDFVLAILRVDANESNGFDKVSKYLRAIDKASDKPFVSKKGYVVLDFGSKSRLERLLQWMRAHSSLKPFLEGATLGSLDECEEFAVTMLENIHREREDDPMSSPRTRIKRRGHKANKSNSESKEVLLVFPFDTAEFKIDAAAESLKELNRVIKQAAGSRDAELAEALDRSDQGVPEPAIHEARSDHAKDQSSSSDSDAGADVKVEAGTADETKKKVRAHYLTIRREDTDRLAPGEFLNDTLIDFWMEWYVAFHFHLTAVFLEYATLILLLVTTG